LLTLALCVLFADVSIHSTVFAAANVGHDCHADHSHNTCHDDGACPVCAHLTTAGNLLNSFSPPIANTLWAFVFSVIDSNVPESTVFNIDTDTPVTLKVKLNS